MITRLAVVAMAWLIPAGLAAGARRFPALIPLYPASLAAVAALTGAVGADELRARSGDGVYESCMKALEHHDRRRARDLGLMRAAERAAMRNPQAARGRVLPGGRAA
jgi:hypothetical protein